ncbi:Tigger transposable element-derived protein 7-like 18, partial [Homarus americanus]
MGPKRKHTQLTVAQKLELLQKLESGWSVCLISEAYGSLQSFALKYSPDSSTSKMTVEDHKLMRVEQDQRLEDAVFKWYSQQHSSGVAVHGVEMQMAAEKLATHLGIPNFNASDGWLWRVRRRHGIVNRKVCGEAASTPTDEIKHFRKMLTELIARGLLLSQVYNADETGLFWRSLPENTQAMAKEYSTHGRKLDKAQFSVIGQSTLQNLWKYDIKAAIFNWAAAWKDVKVLTLAKGWRKFDEGDPGFQLMTEEIAASCAASDENDDENEKEDITLFAPML